MARRKTSTVAPGSDVRTYLVDRFHRLAGLYEGVPGADRHFGRLSDRAASSEPMTVYWWQLPKWLEPRPRHGRWTVAENGEVVPSDG